MNYNKERRQFLKTTALAGMSLPFWPMHQPAFGMKKASNKFPVCIFSKHLQWLDYEETGKYARDLGYEGIDLTVREGGHVPPEEVERLLPRAIREISKSGLEVPMMATNINDADDPLTEKVLKVASGEGVKFYRMQYFKYDPGNEILADLEQFRVKMEKLAELNEKYGIHGAYQNHAGNYVGASIWDIRYLLQNLDPNWSGVQFDIRHATVEGGQSWPIDLKLIKDFIRCSVVKDFLWEKDATGRWNVVNTPIGEGMVNFDRYFTFFKEYALSGPISMHIEYDIFHGKEESFSKSQKMVYAEKVLRHDLEAVKSFMNKAGLNG